jgi:hypothetical protein
LPEWAGGLARLGEALTASEEERKGFDTGTSRNQPEAICELPRGFYQNSEKCGGEWRDNSRNQHAFEDCFEIPVINHKTRTIDLTFADGSRNFIPFGFELYPAVIRTKAA